jgi:spore coat polysaccharide biosynthesis predicted glycosyltransferase SpsG
MVFRVGAGPRIGLGHLRRSVSLAQAFRREGVRSFFLVSGSSAGLSYLSRLNYSGKGILSSSAWGSRDVEVLQEMADRWGVRSVVVDSCDVPSWYLTELKRRGFFVVVRDDLGRSHLSVDLLLNGNANADQLPYEANGSETSFLLCPKYAVLPPEFWNGFQRRVKDSVCRILVTLGGGDPNRLIPQLLRRLDLLAGGFVVTAVVGPFFRNRAELRRVVHSLSRKVRWVQSPASLFRYMTEADLAISGAGQTLYELACVGCPTVAIQMAGSQQRQLQALVRKGCVRSAGGVDDKALLPKVQAAILSLLGDPVARQRMADAGQRLVDGQGALRVTQIIRDRLL